MIKDEIDKLKHNEVFKRIYSKWRMRRQRDKTISLEMAQSGALWEYGEKTKEQNTTQTEDTPDPENYYVRIGGRTYSNKEWKELMALQKRLADTSINPSPEWELLTVNYLKRMFKEDEKKPHKDRSVDLWDE